MGYHIRVKICGVTRPEDALAAAELGADAIGLNFVPRSPRFLDDDAARAILEVVPPFVEPVAVFADLPLDDCFAMMRRIGPMRVLQWHGEAPEILPVCLNCYVPAFPVRDESSLGRIRTYLEMCRQHASMPAALLIDGYKPGQHGGTGQVAPWELLRGFDPGVPLILAGGLTPENVAQAVRIVRPWAVDVAGGVESSPGIKNHDLLRRFIAAAREAAQATE